MSDDTPVTLSDSGVLANWAAAIVVPRHPTVVPSGHGLEDYHPIEDPDPKIRFCNYKAALNVSGSVAQIEAVGSSWLSPNFFSSIQFTLKSNSGSDRVNIEDIALDIAVVADHYLFAEGDEANPHQTINDNRFDRMRLFWCEQAATKDLVVRALIDWTTNDGEGYPIRTMWSWGMINLDEDRCPVEDE